MQRLYIGGAYRAALAAFTAALIFTACGGGGGTNALPPRTKATPTPTAAPTATPTPQPLPAPTAQSNTQAVAPSTTATTTAVLPTTGGIAATVAVPKLTAGSGNVTVTIATGADATMDRGRRAFALRGDSMPGGSYLAQMDFVPDHDMTLGATPGFSLDVTQWVTAAGFSVSQAATFLQTQMLYAGIVDNAGNFNVVGPLTVSSTSTAVTITYAGAAVALTLKANQHYTIGVHLGPISAATATPAPTSAPTASPAPTSAPTASPTPTSAPTASPTPTSAPTASPTPDVLTIDPTSLDLSGTGSTNMRIFTVTAGAGPYVISGYDSSIISVTSEFDGGGYYDVTPLAAGSTTITITDATGATAKIPVTVTTANGVIQ